MGGTSPTEHGFVINYHYKKIDGGTAGVEDTVWTPASGKLIHIMAVLVSVDKEASVEFRDGTAAAAIATFEFKDKNTVPFSPGMELALVKDHILNAKVTSVVGTASCHITAFGDEH